MASAAAGEATGKFSKFGLALGNSAGLLAAFGTNTVRYSKNLLAVGKSEGIAKVGATLLKDGIAAIPFGPVGIAIAATAAVATILYFAFRNSTTAASKLTSAMQSLVASSTSVTLQKNLAVAISASNKALHEQVNVTSQIARNNVHQASTSALNDSITAQKQYSSLLVTGVDQAQQYGQRMNYLSGVFGSTAAAQAALNLVGISAGKIAGETDAEWRTQYQELKNLAAGYGYMSSQAGAAGAQLNALNLVAGTTFKNIQALTGAESQWITTVTGGESAFISFEQGFTGLNSAIGHVAKNAPTVTVNVGKIRTTFQALGGTMKGTSASSLAVRQAFDQQLTAGTTLWGNLQMLAGASGNTAKAQRSLGKAGKDIIAQLLPFAAGSKQATSEVSALAQLMGGPATSDFKTLAKWVGHTKGAMGDLNTQQAGLTVSAANLTTAEKNLGNVLQNEITAAQAAAIAKTANLTGATQNLAAAATNAKGKMTEQALLAAGQYVNSLERAGLSNKDATSYLNAYLGRLGYGQDVIKTMDGALSGNKKKFEDVAGSMGLSKKAADKLFDSLQNLKKNSPYNPKVNDFISGSGGIVAKANIPGRTCLRA
jgi:hypothetical protein